MIQSNCVTEGERLCLFLQKNFLSTVRWGELADMLAVTGRGNDLVDFFSELTVVGLTGRIVVGGSSLADETPMTDPTFERGLRELLIETTEVPRARLNEVVRQATYAVKAARREIAPSTLSAMRAWSQREHPRCYMCAASLRYSAQDYTQPEKNYDLFTLDHIWPRMYGGNSETDNLLPACLSCNSKKKGAFATWAMTSLQSLIFARSPSQDTLEGMPGWYKFALHYRAVQRFANENKLTLKNAFKSVGPWTQIRTRNPDDVADFFNLANHRETPVISRE